MTSIVQSAHVQCAAWLTEIQAVSAITPSGTMSIFTSALRTARYLQFVSAHHGVSTTDGNQTSKALCDTSIGKLACYVLRNAGLLWSAGCMDNVGGGSNAPMSGLLTLENAIPRLATTWRALLLYYMPDNSKACPSFCLL